MEPRPDLLIVGGGVIGLSVAYRALCLRPGLRVVLLDRPLNAGIASLAAAGMLAPHCEFGEPGPLFTLCRAALVEAIDLAAILHAETGIDPGLRRMGALMPAFSEEEAAHLERRHAFLRQMDSPVERWTARQALERVEGMAATLREALWLPGEATLNSRLYHAALQHACLLRGLDRRDAEITAVERSPGGGAAEVRILEAGSTRPSVLRPHCTVVAAGAWSEALGHLFDLHLPVTPMKGQVVRLDLRSLENAPIIHTHQVYLAPRTGFGVVAGATMEDAGFDTAVDDATVAAIRADAARLYPAAAAAPLLESWAGLRPRPVDGLPIMGWAGNGRTGDASLLLATGHFRNGILLSAITGRLMAHLALEGEIPRDLAPVWNADAFSPARFAEARP